MMTMMRKRYFFGIIALLLVTYLLQFSKIDQFWTTKRNISQMLEHPRKVSFPKVSGKAETYVSKRFSERRSYVEKICKFPNRTKKHVSLVTGYGSTKLTLCTVPKAACTLWLRLFTYLVNKRTSNKTITSLSKYDVHIFAGKNYKRYDFEKDKKLILNSKRAMTTRDPYTRLWSAYIDKFLLPAFWKDKGIQVITMTRPNATAVAKRCGNDVTFPEFIQYVLKIGHSMAYWGFDYHWLPVSDICDPCVFKPDYIVKQETFISDFTHVVDQVGLLDDVRPVLEVDQVEYEIETEVDYNFRIYKQISSCVTKLQLSKLIWKAMKLNGYLQPDEKFPAHLTEEKVNKSTIVGFVQAARKRNDSNKQTKKDIRKKALIDAYRQLSKNQLTSLQELYKVDFKMFGYNSSLPG